jgi:cell volume regulation protein A
LSVSDGELILITGAMLAGGLIASLVAVRVRVPALVLFLVLGIVAGSDVTGWIYFDDYELARTVGIVALALILFEGGLAASFREIRPVLRPAISLAFVGTILTAVVSGLAAAWLFDFSILEGLLLGSILAATDGAAVFSILRGSTLKRKLAQTLEGEAGLNDPVAVVLVIGFIDWIQQPDYGLVDEIALFVTQLGIGAVVGLSVGWLAVGGFRRAPLSSGGLYPVASLATAAIAYGAADSLHGSGFLAVYLAGLVLGSAAIPARRTVAAFHDGLAWIAQLTMFFTLGLLVFPSELGGIALEGSTLALVVVFVARPAAAFVATMTDRFTAAERLALGWAGLRGAVPVVLATFPVIEGIPGSIEFFNIVFFAVLLSTVLQGSTFELLARKLGLTTNEPALPQPLAEIGTIRGLGAEVVEYPVAPGDAIVGVPIRELGLPREAVVNVIVRGKKAIPPRGSTRIGAGDRLHILVRREAADVFPSLLDRWRDGPIAAEGNPADQVWMQVPVERFRGPDENEP